MLVKSSRRNSVHNLKDSRIAQLDSCRWEELGVQGVELIGICVCPEGQTVDTPDDFESALERSDNIFSRESICLSTDSWNSRVGAFCEFIHDLFHNHVWLFNGLCCTMVVLGLTSAFLSEAVCTMERTFAG